MEATTLSPDVEALEATTPPGASTMRLAIPAFWPPNSPHWQGVQNAGSAVSAVVIEGSWPGAAATNSQFKAQAQQVLGSLPGAVLGYVSTRVNGTGPLRGQAAILQDAKAWYDQFGQLIDGIYFDELVIPERPGDIDDALARVAAFKAARPQAKVMILAGQCPDERVVGPNINWALLWEDKEVQYRQAFAARVQANLKPIPSWWKDPAHRHKIAHTVHDCAEPARQHALGLASERNAGNVFVMDQRGLKPGTTNEYVLYDHLPPYWPAEIREVNSYYDFGFDPQRALQAAHRYGKSQGKLHAWPNFEMAWRPIGHVRGTFLLDAGAHATERDVLRTDLPGQPPLFDIPAVWRAAHKYAQSKGFETALPTFERVQKPNGAAIRLILFAKNLPWLTAAQAPVGSTYQQPHFSEPGAVVRNVNRWAGSQGHKASFPTFVADDPAIPNDRTNFYNCYVLSNAAPVMWQDVLTSTYIDQLVP